MTNDNMTLLPAIVNANKILLLFLLMFHYEKYYPVFSYLCASIPFFSRQCCVLLVQFIPARNCLVDTHCRCNMFIFGFSILYARNPTWMCCIRACLGVGCLDM